MKILVLNCGSSSIKYKLFDMTTKEVLAQGGIEKIGLVGSFLKLTLPNGEKKILEKDIPEHTAGIEFILNTLVSPEYGAIKSLDEINAVGHRMVHGGERFSESVLLNKEVQGSIYWKRLFLNVAYQKGLKSANITDEKNEGKDKLALSNLSLGLGFIF